jgi:hypothetical protein
MPENPFSAFICHSHKDRKHLEELRAHLTFPEHQHQLQIWSSQDIESGARWQQEIDARLATATVAVLLVSSEFLASPFIRQQELPILLQRAREGKLRLLSVLLRECLFNDSPLAKYQPLNTQPLGGLPKARRDVAWTGIAAQITAALLPAEAERKDA